MPGDDKYDTAMGKAEPGAGCGRAGPGRPLAMPTDERRRVVLDALSDLFSEGGLDGMTMAAIARRSGMSKRTLYSIFGDRDSLLLAYLERLTENCTQPMTEAEKELPLADRLRLLLVFQDKPGGWDLPLAILRLAVASAPEAPEVGSNCLSRGPVVVVQMIEEELKRSVARGEIPPIDTAASARMLKDMIYFPVIDALLDRSFRPTTAETRQRCELALAIFMKGIGGVPAT